jgi:hypothetical protein
MARVSGLVLVAVLAVACSSNKTGGNIPSGQDGGGDPNITNPDGGPGGNGDGGIGSNDAGFRCNIDDDCAVFGRSLRCNDATHECIPGKRCNDATNCFSQEPEDYCSDFGPGCRCVPESSDDGLSGVCRRRHGVCDPCTADSECGVEPSFDPQGKCLALSGDTTGKKYCFNKSSGACPKGMVSSGGYCVPQSGSCDQVGCSSDTDCRSGEVCNTDTSLCESRCFWDYVNHTTASPGCPAGQTCWVDQANLNPSSLVFGAGRCRPPCGSEAECTDTSLNPFGGASLTCAEDPTGGMKRCRAKGECMDVRECSSLPPGSLSLGYCDKGTFTCESDCRTGTNPATGKPYSDCVGGYKCQASASGNQCVEVPCYEIGKVNACGLGRLCAGEDRTGDGVGDPVPSGVTAESNGCYQAPVPPFCQKCTSHEQCNTFGNFSGSGLPYACLGVQDGDTGRAENVCVVSTFNDERQDAMGQPRNRAGCPNGYGPMDLFLDLSQTADYCASHADCGPKGLCAPDALLGKKTCMCTRDGASTCPTNTVCKKSNLTTDRCVVTIGCYPNAFALWTETSSGGCGF